MTSAATPGRLIGSGRAADVYEIDARRVLRRYRVPFDVGTEAAVMAHLRSAGYPVPEVFDAAALTWSWLAWMASTCWPT